MTDTYYNFISNVLMFNVVVVVAYENLCVFPEDANLEIDTGLMSAC
jgi:hypothetical protein